MGKRVIIFKFGAGGDVLRTTAILPGLKNKYPDSKVYWVTTESSKPVLENNYFIDKIYLESELSKDFKKNKYDIIINLDEDRRACQLAGELNSERVGLYLKDGEITCSDKAKYWMSMSLLGGPDKDCLKRTNTFTYQKIMYDILGIPHDLKYRPILNLTPKEKEFGIDFLRKNKIDFGLEVIVGLNTNAGMRWPLKEMPIAKTVNVIDRLIKAGFRVLLFGGHKEIKRNETILKLADKRLVNTGCGNTIREFASLINICNVLISADTLAMHIGIALGKYTIAFFGPTPYLEIEFYANGKAIFPNLDCIGCMKKVVCEKKPNCMDLLDEMAIVETVLHYRKMYNICDARDDKR